VQLVVLVLVGLPLHYGYLVSGADVLAEPAVAGDDSTAGAGWRLGADISRYLGVAHGWLYMIFLLTGLLLARRARWPLGFTIVTLLCGTVPLLSFWAEHRASRLTRAGVGWTQSDPARS
jgi:integral membrane protein